MFNPGLWQTDGEVIRQFSVREYKFRTLMNIISTNIDSESCQNSLVIAPSGQDKTMFIARIAAELRTESRYMETLIPVHFMEETHEVFTIDDFWMETLFHLETACKSIHPALSMELLLAFKDSPAQHTKKLLESYAYSRVLNAIEILGRKIVILVENFQALCRASDDDFGWKLRGALQTDSQLILIATAASRSNELDDAREPFLGLFRTIHLHPLTAKKCSKLWQGTNGERVTARQVIPLQVLTAGNPRRISFISRFSRKRSFSKFLDNIAEIIDQDTHYFRSQLTSTPKGERRVYVAILDSWKPSTAREIANRARVGIQVASTLIGRLVDCGAVSVEGTGKSKHSNLPWKGRGQSGLASRWQCPVRAR